MSGQEEGLQWKVLIKNVLSCLYTYNKTYEPMYVYLSFPVVLAFFDKKCSESKEITQMYKTLINLNSKF